VQASEDVVPASHLRETYAKIRDLERALGRKTMEFAALAHGFRHEVWEKINTLAYQLEHAVIVATFAGSTH
jgi:hypothetical protein